MHRLVLFLLLVSMLFAGCGQEPENSASPAVLPGGQVGSEAGPVRQLFEAMGLSGQSDEMIRLFVETQCRIPALAPHRSEIEVFCRKYMGWEAMKEDMAALYEKTFTGDELAALTEFYRSPAGRKLVAVQPELTARMAQIGQERIQAHLTELQAIVGKARERGR